MGITWAFCDLVFLDVTSKLLNEFVFMVFLSMRVWVQPNLSKQLYVQSEYVKIVEGQ